jgi:NOL1/NOP2/fmu family ribosome biogenesis protein
MVTKPINRKESGKIIKQINEDFGCDMSWMQDKYYFFLSDKNKVYIVNMKLNDIPLDNVKLNSHGLYFCEMSDHKIRLSIEGSMMVGKSAGKNVYEVDDATARSWLKGNDITCSENYVGFIILKNNDDFLGCGKVVNGQVYNYIPKIRRINSVD